MKIVTQLANLLIRIWPLQFLLLAMPVCAQPDTDIITLVSPESDADRRNAYSLRAITLALEKTREQFGDYKINYTPIMNTARALEESRANHYSNLMVMTTFQNKVLENGLDYARFPVGFGVMSYRICFVSPQAREAVANSKTLDELRRFTIVQGVGWADVAILRQNGFKVQEIGKYESMFRMVAAGHVDLFCRGINEIENEVKNHENMANLDYDRSFALAYPLPRFFMSNAKNSRALERVSKGLLMAYRDGSLRKLWLEQYKTTLQFADLEHRQIFNLQSPNMDRIDFDYQKYSFMPSKGK